ncbi:acyl-CoA dehydrogenase family protein, partial [Mycobacterium avium]|uniref:acyl-CoA dehydrogenase family protein n=1 Tax=Mycobacterium avium TaxID=1764 RepID=UPI001F2A3697
MAPETTSTAEHLRNALDGRWRDVRNRMRETLSEDLFRPHYTPNTVIARTKVAEQMRIMAAFGAAADGFRKEHGGTGDVGAAITMIEMLAMSDLSLMVKAGVQWGLFGGAVENLGTERHHETYVPKIISLELRGCFAMTETGHGSDVQSLETTATYDPATEEFVIDSPTPSARKDYIGGAAETATVAAVFAQLITTEDGKPVNHGVHCLLVPIRDADGNDLPGVTTSDCEYKGGLPGVDNGRIVFDHVRGPRVNLLNKYGDVAPDGTYSSPIENPNRRFFTMLGTLVRGRITVGGSAGAAGGGGAGCATRASLPGTHCTAAPRPRRTVAAADLDPAANQRAQHCDEPAVVILDRRAVGAVQCHVAVLVQQVDPGPSDVVEHDAAVVHPGQAALVFAVRC